MGKELIAVKKFLILILSLVSISGLSGCTGTAHKPKPMRIVSQIEADFQGSGGKMHRNYQDPHKMEQILNKLRLLELNTEPQNPPVNLFADTLKITLHFEDGSRKRYKLHSGRYLCSDTYGWRSVRETEAQKLLSLIQDTDI